MNLYRTRVGNINEEERTKLICEEIIQLEKDIEIKTKKVASISTFFWWINASFTLATILLASAITIVTAIYNSQVVSIVLGGIIIVIASVREVFKIGDQGFNFRGGTFRLKRIKQNVRDLLHLFHTFSIEEILMQISSFKTQIDEIDLELYKNSIPNPGKSMSVLQSSNIPTVSNIGTLKSDSNSHVFIHIDTPSSSPRSSPINSPSITPRNNSTSNNNYPNIVRESFGNPFDTLDDFPRNSLSVSVSNSSEFSQTQRNDPPNLREIFIDDSSESNKKIENMV